VTGFKHPALKQLTDQQVRFAPPARRLEQMARAQQLLAEVEPGRQYPYQWVCFRITEFRPEAYPDLLISGADLAHDLAWLIEALGDTISAPIGVPAGEPQTAPATTEGPLVTLDELSKRLNVSTKTIRRWRKLGLVGRRALRAGKYQICFQQMVIDRFLTLNRDRVERGGRFSQMNDAEREDILRRAKRLSRVYSGTLTEVSRRIARRLGRSVETVRYTIKNFDRENPEQALFPRLTGPLDTQTKESI